MSNLPPGTLIHVNAKFPMREETRLALINLVEVAYAAAQKGILPDESIAFPHAMLPNEHNQASLIPAHLQQWISAASNDDLRTQLKQALMVYNETDDPEKEAQAMQICHRIKKQLADNGEPITAHYGARNGGFAPATDKS